MTQTWPFWVTQIVQMMPGIPTPNSLIKNGEILMKNREKFLKKMAEMTQKWLKMVKMAIFGLPKWSK